MLRARALILCVLLSAGAMGDAAQAQNALPTNGHVVAGSATIAPPVGNTLTVNQLSNRAVINWNTFSVGQPNTVDFLQPGSAAAILNRVTGSTTSTIAGQIVANGQVYLVNPNGIAITPTGSVQVGGGFVASTLGITDSNFMSGNLSFTGNGASAGVSNAGSIAVGSGGYVGLLGGTAANSGTIAVPLGKVALGSGEAATLDLNGDGFMQVAAPTGATTAKGQALVSNSGRIEAAGGTVELKAATVASAIRNAVNMSGVVAANSASGHDGAITLSGGPGGAVNVTGTLEASAPPASSQPSAHGGAITVSGAKVRVGHHAVLNASGAKGGSVLVGVTGAGGQGEAAETTIASGAKILALGDATVAGSGGYIETSGETLKFGGATINPGKGGTWLADPTDLTIDTAAAATISSTLNGGSDVLEETAGDGTTSGAGNTSSGNGDIIVDAAIAWSTSNTLTLSAFNGITVNAPITVSGAGNLVLTTNNNINGTSTGNGVVAFTPTLGSAQFTNTEVGGQTLTINGAGYALLYNMGEVQGINSGLTGNYALAVPLDASIDTTTPPSWTPIGNHITAFTGNFTGLGNAIANLAIQDTTDSTVGLFGQLGSGATISDIGFVGGSVTGGALASIGGLVGANSGTISDAYATVAVSGGQFTNVGGLVGTNAGTISTSFATGSVNSSGNNFTGGLVGENSGGTITESYATGSVSGDEGYVGGLVGFNINSSITDAYATGSVSGGGSAVIGGLVGQNNGSAITDAFATGALSAGSMTGGLVGQTTNGATVTDGYYDTDTTGATTDGGTAVGKTTAQLQSFEFTDTANFQNNTNWGIISGVSYPYLTSLYPFTPQVVSGTAFQDQGATLAAGGIAVSALVDGVNVGTTGTGANGAYYFLLQANTIPSGDGVLTYSTRVGISGGAAFTDGITGGVATGVTIYGDTLHEITADTSNFVLQGNLANAVGFDPTVTNLLPNLVDLRIDASGSFDIDQSLIATGTVMLNAGGSISEEFGSVILSADASITSHGRAVLDQHNDVQALDNFTNAGTQGYLVFVNTDAGGLETGGVSNPVGNITLGNEFGLLAITGPISASRTVVLVSGGAISEPASVGGSILGSITARSLAVEAEGAVDLAGANAVHTLAANVDGGNSFDLVNTQTLRVGSVFEPYSSTLLQGVTTDGSAGVEANIVLQTTVGDILIDQPISTNGLDGPFLGLSLGQIGLQAAGNITENGGRNTSGELIAFAVEAVAGGSIDLDGSASLFGNRVGGNDNFFGAAMTAGTFSAETTGTGSALTFNDSDAPLIIDTVTTGTGDGVAAGSVTLPLVSGVFSNGGDITLGALQDTVASNPLSLRINAPISANNFVSGSPSTTLQGSPGGVFLLAQGGNVSQSSTGLIYGGELYAESDSGNVFLTQANRIGADDVGGIAQTAGLAAGFASGNFSLVDHNAPLTIGALPGCRICIGVFANNGSINLATTGAGGITVNQPVNSGATIAISVAPGSGFTNSAVDNPLFDRLNHLGLGVTTAGLDTSFAGAPITILADQMTLSAGTINAGSGGVVLAPATTTDGIVLGAAGSTGVLGLQSADLAGITAGFVQVGYRHPSGNVALTGNISVTGTLSVDADTIPQLLLVTGGAITESGSGAITGTGSQGLQLGIIASGANSLTGANDVGTLAAYIDGTNPSLAFSNADALTVGALSSREIGVVVDGATGIPTAGAMSGPESNPLSGIVTSGGAATTGGVMLTTSSGGITVGGPVSTGAQPVSLSAVGAIAFDNTVNTTSAFSATAGSGGGAAVAITQNSSGLLTLGGSASFANDGTGGTIALTQANPISGTVSLSTTGGGADAALTSTLAFMLTSATAGGNLTVTDAAGLTISGGVSSTGTISLTGPLTLATAANVAAPTIDISGATSLALNGGAMLGQSGATIDLASTAGSGAVTEATTATIIASMLAATDGLTGNVSLVGAENAVQSLSAISVTGSGNGFSLVTNSPLAVNGALTTASGPVSLTTGGNLTLASTLSAPGSTATLISGGSISQAGGAIIAATLTGSSAGNAAFGQSGNNIAALGAFATTNGGANGNFTLVDAQPGGLSIAGVIDAGAGTIALTTSAAGITEGVGGRLDPGSLAITSAGPVTMGNANTVDTLAASITGAGAALLFNDTANSLSVGSVNGINGIITNAGDVTLSTTTFGDIALNQPTNVGGANTITLTSAGSISETTRGTLTANILTGAAGSFAALSNISGNLVNFLGPLDSDSGFFSFTNGQRLTTTGDLTSATGMSLLTTGTGSSLVLGGNLTAGGGVELVVGGTITQSSGVISADSIIGNSVGGATLTDANKISTVGLVNTGNGALAFANAQSVAMGSFESPGDVTVTTTGGGSNLVLGNVSSGQTATFNVAGNITQPSASIAATNLIATTKLDAGGSIMLGGVVSGNVTLTSLNGAGTALAAGSISFADGVGFTIASQGGLATGIATLGAVSAGITSLGRNLAIAPGATVTGGGVALDALTGDFINNAGPDAITATGGNRWLIYSYGPAGDVFGGLNSNNTAIWESPQPSSVTATGNRYLFAQPQLLTVTTTSDSKVYGADATAAVANDYTVTGYAPGVANAFLGDSAATAYTGTPSVTSAGSAATAPVSGSPYAIIAAAGTMRGLNGYYVIFPGGGELSVTPIPLTVTATDQSRLPGQLNPPLTFGITSGSLAAGDSLSGMLATTATPSSPIGFYPITQGTLAASTNYTLTFVDGVLTVRPDTDLGVALSMFFVHNNFTDPLAPHPTACPPGSIAALLSGGGQADLFGGSGGGGGGGCGP